ncbi:phage minor tail protein L [Pseudomonas alliivorans]|uniref:phage minor tail protein L n=1 Tax=Pseudomonas alliivorans TaxID=2810613 RepID=UPI001AE32883|nr:phage minor tail protein L [Pseudomonas alliivorans]MBP0943082.1 phage minor tail protein L [Pseudomonas alliivorans]MEE4881178.1 phage minor tail protein L [Pseudomonas alliivorans]MEE4932482.1 phage minor tail protein L [Pseudomonas alliivorans]MEE4937945.1 phage minor tail protein L [Pseudomonas alliivorans]MEE4943122.1 phage minor tail protein L [Pseudomonas alliivorans]
MSLIADIQLLEPGSEVMLFELDGADYGADVLRFHGHAIPHGSDELIAAGLDADQLPAKSIWWQGNEYSAWPIQIEGIEANGDGTAVRPTFIVGNVNGRITALCLAFEDLLEFKLTMHHTLGRYLDGANFSNGNPDADSTQESIEVWYLDQKTNEDGETVSWELASPGDVGGESIGRQMTTLCHWCLTGGYRGPDCGYTGGYVDKDGVPTDNPELDVCDATLGRGCIPRFGENNELPFGGFPAVSLIARS